MTGIGTPGPPLGFQGLVEGRALVLQGTAIGSPHLLGLQSLQAALREAASSSGAGPSGPPYQVGDSDPASL